MADAENTQAAEDWPDPRHAWFAVVMLTLALILAFADRFVLSLLVEPIKADLLLSDTQIGLLQGLPFGVFYTLFAIPLGRLADNSNRRNLLLICIFIWSVLTAMCGLARSYTFLFLARIGVATGEAGLGPITMTLISDYFPKDKRTKPFGLFLSGTHIGGGLALIIGGAIVEMVTSGTGVSLPLIGPVKAWQLAFILVGLPGLLLLPLVAAIREPERKGGSEKFDITGVLLFIRQHWQVYLAIFLGMSCMGTVASAIIAWGPATFMRIYGWDFQQIGFGFGSVILVSGVSGSLLAGSVENFFSKRGYEDAKIRGIVTCGFIMSPISFLGILSGDAYFSLLAIALTIFLCATPLVLGPAAIMAITPGRLRGQMGAIYIVFIGLLGGFIGPMLVPLLTDYVFQDDAALLYSLAIVVGTIGPLGGILLYMNRGHYVDADRLCGQAG